jgi:RNA polymerase sigma factor (sigma-70 family)
MSLCRPWLRQRAKVRLSGELARKLDGSDLVQECMYLASAQFAEFKGESLDDLRAWLGGIMDRRRSRALRFWSEKRRDRRREVPLIATCSARETLAQTSTSILDRLSQKEECQRLKLAASWCREEDLALISMHLFKGQSHDEIAALLQITATAARQRYCRAIRRVGEALQLLQLMTQRGIDDARQDVIGLHRFRGADPEQIADRLRLPRKLVARWIAEAKPLFGTIAKESP